MDSSSSTKIKCNDCDETFSIQPLYRIHKKQHHQKSVPLCNNTANGLCKYGKNNCWFIHENITETTENKTENNEVIQKLFTIMEAMTERLSSLEKLNNKLIN